MSIDSKEERKNKHFLALFSDHNCHFYVAEKMGRKLCVLWIQNWTTDTVKNPQIYMNMFIYIHTCIYMNICVYIY